MFQMPPHSYNKMYWGGGAEYTAPSDLYSYTSQKWNIESSSLCSNFQTTER